MSSAEKAQVSWHGIQHQGARDYQEDCWAAILGDNLGDGLLLVVCDGMGGHAGGALASRTATQAFCQRFFRDQTDGNTEQRLALALQAAQAAIGEQARLQNEYWAMGTTLVAVWIHPGGLNWISVGDSLLIRVTPQGLERLNADHSMAPVLDELVAIGRLSSAEAETDSNRNALRSALGTEPPALVDSGELKLSEGQPLTLLLASDGVQSLTDAELQRLLNAPYADAADLCRRLVEGVLDKRRPNQDNLTVLCYCVAPSSPSPGLLQRVGGGLKRLWPRPAQPGKEIV
ncbi:PP2C family protein-serine/threonine phosphatase [Pseudomonas sp. 10-1B]|uniref:PP2C family protein-serine/threonine phosphatase n=1 Tax=Pseudomonas sp. 10-1B TaxID=1546029 RepID=UPI0006A7A480|nr:protein phosphatase 2C domain-containing protein [Pseudomonas sp. 10-1B]